MTIKINKRQWVKTLFTIHCSLFISMMFASCSEDEFIGDPAKDWAGTTTSFNSADEKGFSTYYKPVIGRCGDPMPFFDQKAGEFKVLYLQEYDNNGACYHPIWGISTSDAAHYQSLSEVLPTGSSAYEQDAAIGTGCCVYNEQDGLYYIYYTGHNDKCQYTEVVLRATSSDFKNWTKDISWSLIGPKFGYSATDFRDPQIFKADDGLYHMVISTRPISGGDPKFAEFKSADMKTWEHAGNFNMVWDRMCECPDIFQMGNWWYAVFSELPTWSRRVKYMKATSFDALKACFSNPGANWPDNREGKLDSRAFYAGKTASNGTDRYIWGWCPTRSGADIHEKNTNVGDDKEPNWAGALVCHKLIQHEDGSLTLGEVPAIRAKYNQEQTVSIMASNNYADGKLSGNDAYVLYSRLGVHNHISLTVTTSNNWDKFGISLVRGTDSKKYYTMIVNPEGENLRKINFEQEGPWSEEDEKTKDPAEKPKGFIGGIDSYTFTRPGNNTYKIDIYTDNSVMVMYINDNVCYTNRIYGIQKNCWSVNNYGGSVTVSEVRVSQY